MNRAQVIDQERFMKQAQGNRHPRQRDQQSPSVAEFSLYG